MEVLEFDEWPLSQQGSGKEPHPVILESVAMVKNTDKVLRFTEADLEELPHKSLVLLEQRLRNLAKQQGFRISCLHRRENDIPVMYVRRNPRRK